MSPDAYKHFGFFQINIFYCANFLFSFSFAFFKKNEKCISFFVEHTHTHTWKHNLGSRGQGPGPGEMIRAAHIIPEKRQRMELGTVQLSHGIGEKGARGFF